MALTQDSLTELLTDLGQLKARTSALEYVASVVMRSEEIRTHVEHMMLADEEIDPATMEAVRRLTRRSQSP